MKPRDCNIDSIDSIITPISLVDFEEENSVKNDKNSIKNDKGTQPHRSSEFRNP